MAKSESKPAMPAGQARELAREELMRWQRTVDILSTAAAWEDEHGDTERRLTALREQRTKAEAETNTALDGCLKAVQEAEEGKERALERIRDETAVASAALREQLADLTAQVQRAQTDLIQIERDKVTAQERAEADLTATRAQLDAAQADLDAIRKRLAA